MKAASVQQIKAELANLSEAELTNLCLRLIKYKKENKALLGYLLFEAHDEDGYISQVKNEITELFAEVNTTNAFFAKKTLRKILRITNQHIKYTGSKTAEIELLIHFCNSLKNSKVLLQKSTVLRNILDTQIKKIHKLLPTLHEDLQHDYWQLLNAC